MPYKDPIKRNERSRYMAKTLKERDPEQYARLRAYHNEYDKKNGKRMRQEYLTKLTDEELKELKANGSRKAKERRKKLLESGLCTRCTKNSLVPNKTLCQSCVEEHVSFTKELRIKKHKIALEHYGSVCNCCGESDEIFLTFDHINNDGNNHRRQLGRGMNLPAWLIKNKFPSNFQILCYNCNIGKYKNNGVCPHIKEME